MLILSAKEIKLSLKSCINLVHPRENTNPTIVSYLKLQKGIRCQVVYPGNTFVQANTFDQFETVLIHDCNSKNLIDFRKRLFNIKDRLESAMTSPTRKLVVIGEAIKLLPAQLLSIPTVGNVIASKKYTSSSIIDEPGLGLIDFYMVPTDSKSMTNQMYARNIKYYAHSYKPMYLMFTDSVYSSDGNSIGNFCQIDNDAIKPKPELPKIELAKSKIRPIKAYYEEDFDEDGNLKTT